MTAAKRVAGAYHSCKVIPGRNVTILDPHAVKPVPQLVPEEKQPLKLEARVVLIKEGDVVTGIEIHCKCGEVIRVDCEY